MSLSINGDLLSRAGVVRRICPVFFLLDCSGSMNGLEIGAVNTAIEYVLPVLADMNTTNSDTEISVAIFKFCGDKSDNSDVVEWVTGDDGLVNLNGYSWKYLDAYGITPMGKAFEKLNDALSVKHGFMKRASGSVAPVLFLLTDGYATDDAEAGLQQLQNNNWYKLAVRVAIGYGGKYDRDLLIKFTQNEETVIDTDDPTDLARMIKFVTITSSMVASKGSSSTKTDEGMNNTDKAAEEISSMLNGFGPETAASVSGACDPDEEW